MLLIHNEKFDLPQENDFRQYHRDLKKPSSSKYLASLTNSFHGFVEGQSLYNPFPYTARYRGSPCTLPYPELWLVLVFEASAVGTCLAGMLPQRPVRRDPRDVMRRTRYRERFSSPNHLRRLG